MKEALQNRAVFLDRDGIINEVIMRGEKVSSPWKHEEFQLVPGIKSFISTVKERGFKVIVATNQPDVGKGLIDPHDLSAMHREVERLSVDAIEVCTSPDDTDPRRKPNPGMLIEASKKFNLDLATSYFIGDGIKDVLAGRSAGVKTVLLKTSYNTDFHSSADFNCECFEEIMSIIR